MGSVLRFRIRGGGFGGLRRRFPLAALFLEHIEQADLALQVPVEVVILAQDPRPALVGRGQAGVARRRGDFRVLAPEQLVFFRHLLALLQQ